MKKRLGFVSNSSSSSFVLVFSHDAVLPGSDLLTLSEYVGSIVHEDKEYASREEALEHDRVAVEIKDRIKTSERFVRGAADIGGDPDCYSELAKSLGAKLIWLPM